MNTAEELLKPDDALAAGHALTLIDGADADALVDAAPGRDPDRREKLIVTGDLLATMRDAWTIVNRWNKATPRLFKDAGGKRLLQIHDTQTGPVMKPYDVDTFRALLVNLIRFVRPAKKGPVFDISPEDRLIRTMLSTPPDDLPVLSRIVTAPVLGPDSRLTSSTGYHAAGKVFYRPLPGFYIPAIPEAPTAEDVADAVAALREPFAEFPFMDDASTANLIAALLTPFVRDVIDGPTPLFLISKTQRGTGGTLLCDAISTITTGQPASVIPPSKDDAELDKRITGAVAAGRPIILLDNVDELRGTTLAAVLTGRQWGGRLLYSNDTVDVAPRCLWLANGNNPQASGELTRRIVYVRMVAPVANPAARQNFRIPDLIPWCMKNRAALVAAILTIIRAWIVAGRPGGVPLMGSFDSWSRIVGGILTVAGVDGFLANRESLDEDANDEDAAIRELVEDWNEEHGAAAVGVRSLLPLMLDRFDLGHGDEHGKAVKAGCLLRRWTGRIIGNFRIEDVGMTQHRRMYRLADVVTDRQDPACECGESSFNPSYT